MRRIFGLLITAFGLTACITSQYADGYEAYQRGDCATALRNWQLLANQGDRSAQNGIGVMYDAGRCVPQDSVEAAKWFRLSAAKGNEVAQYNLGRSYEFGKGVPQNYAEAVRLYKLSADQGYAQAKRDLSALLTKAATTGTSSPPKTSPQPVAIARPEAYPSHDYWGYKYPPECRKNLDHLQYELRRNYDLGYESGKTRMIGYWWNSLKPGAKDIIFIDKTVTDPVLEKHIIQHELCHAEMFRLYGHPYWHKE